MVYINHEFRRYVVFPIDYSLLVAYIILTFRFPILRIYVLSS